MAETKEQTTAITTVSSENKAEEKTAQQEVVQNEEIETSKPREEKAEEESEEETKEKIDDEYEDDEDEDAEESYRKSPLKKILKSKLFRLAIVTILLVILLLYFLPSLLNGNAIKKQLEIKLSQVLETNLEIRGDVSFALVPSPTLILNKVLVQNYRIKSDKDDQTTKTYNFAAKSLKIRFPIINLSKQFFAQRIIFIEPAVEVYLENNPPSSRQNKFSQMATDYGQIIQPNSTPTPSIIDGIFAVDRVKNYKISKIANTFDIVEGNITIYDEMTKKREINGINGDIEIGSKIKGKFDFSTEGIPTELEINLKPNSKSSKPDSLIHLSSSILNLKIDANITSENLDLLNGDFSGKVSVGIFDLKNFYKNYINSSDIAFYKIKEGAQPIIISADISGHSKEYSISNVQITSNSINGKGSVDISMVKEIPMVDVDLKLDYLDIDALWSSDAAAIEEATQQQNQQQDDGNSANTANANNAANSDTENTQNPVTIATTAPNSDSTSSTNADNTVNTTPTAADLANQPTTIENTKLATDNTNTVNAAPQTADATKATNDTPTTQQALHFTDSESERVDPTNLNIIKQLNIFDLNADISIKNGRYMNGEINDVNAYFTISKDGAILLMPMTLKVPGSSLVYINGVFDNKTKSLKFVGQLEASGKKLGDIFSWLGIESQNMKFNKLADYQVYSDLLLLPNVTVFSDFYLSLPGTNTEAEGEIRINNRGKYSSIVNNFEISNLKVDDYFLISERSSYLSPGSLMKKILWLNDIVSDNEINLTFHDLTYGGNIFPEQIFKIRLGRGYFKIPNFKITSDETEVSGSLNVDIRNKIPEFDLIIDGDKLSYNTKPQIATDADGTSIASRKNNTPHYNVFDRFFFLPSLEGMNGKISLKFDSLNIDDVQMNDFLLKGFLKDGNMDNTTFNCTVYGGSFKYQGFLGIKLDKTVSGGLQFKDIKLKPLLSDFANIGNIDGTANIAASVVAIADSKENFTKVLSSEIKFNIASLTVANYGLTDLMKTMFNLPSSRPDLDEPEKILFDSQRSTFFQQVTGAISFNGSKGKIRANASAPAINAILSGKITPENSSADLLFSAIFLTGNSKKQTPITIATSIKGQLDNLGTNSNVNQVRQYLGLKIIDNAPEVKQEEDTEKVEDKTNQNNTPNNGTSISDTNKSNASVDDTATNVIVNSPTANSPQPPVSITPAQ